MDTQTLNPGSSGPFSSPPSGGGGGSGGRSPLLLILVLVLGLGTVIFGILTVTFSGKAATATKTAAAKAAAAADSARTDQKKLDEDATSKANESPFRSYTAPQKYGTFVINFPKDWSSSVDEESSGTQVNLVLNPDFISRTDGKDDLIAVRVAFIDQTKDRYLNQFASLLKSRKLKQADILVANQPSIDITGQFSDRRTVHAVVVPIRDKVLVFTSEDTKFSTEFGQILAQAKIIP